MSTSPGQARDAACPRVLLIGDSAHREFREAVVWPRRHTVLQRAPTIQAALNLVDTGRSHTVVLAQTRPGQFQPAAVQRLMRRWPLAQFVALLGSLCEGELRSGQPWPGVVRVYWHQWPARCAVELSGADRPTSWQLPKTASPAERTLHALSQVVPPQDGLVAVATLRQPQFQMLSHACRQAGLAAAWIRPDQAPTVLGADVAVWDSAHVATDFAQLRALASHLGPVPIVALLDFPRDHDVRRARALGASAVLARPFLLPDLWSTLRSLIG